MLKSKQKEKEWTKVSKIETELRGLSLLLLLLLLVLAFQEGVFPCSLGCPGTLTVDYDGFELKGDMPAFIVSAGIKDLCHQPPVGIIFKEGNEKKKRKEKEKY